MIADVDVKVEHHAGWFLANSHFVIGRRTFRASGELAGVRGRGTQSTGGLWMMQAILNNCVVERRGYKVLAGDRVTLEYGSTC